MSKWEKLNKEFDDVLNSMTSKDWDNWHEKFKQKPLNQNNMEDERDEYQCPSCGEMRDVEKMCNPDGACDDCQEIECH